MSTDQNLQQTVDRFLAHKRAHGRKYHSEEKELRLLVAFATEHDAPRLSDLTPALLEQFLGSRARSRPKSFNHLRNAVGCLMDWAVSQELLQRRHDDDATGNEEPLFTFVASRPVDPCTASQVFHRVVMALDLPVPDGVSPPTLHSLRHSFAVGCLLRWYRQGLDPASRLHQLSTFMGHVDPSSTAIYLTITPELLDEANRRFEQYAAPAWTEAER